MFLVGGPAFSGTTLLAHLVTQGDVLCLDEPDLHNPEQNHRSTPVLRRRFPGVEFPSPPTATISYECAVDILEQCEQRISPVRLGIKLCNGIFIDYAAIYRARGYPVIAIVRDIRDTLVRPLPAWLDEKGMNDRYRLIWRNREAMDLVVRYEDLVREPGTVLQRIADVLCERLELKPQWNADAIGREMLKNERHQLLTSGIISTSRVGIHRDERGRFSAATLETADLMGYR